MDSNEEGGKDIYDTNAAPNLHEFSIQTNILLNYFVLDTYTLTLPYLWNNSNPLFQLFY